MSRRSYKIFKCSPTIRYSSVITERLRLRVANKWYIICIYIFYLSIVPTAFRMCVCFECHWCISVWGTGGNGGRPDTEPTHLGRAAGQCALRLRGANTRAAPAHNLLAKRELVHIKYHIINSRKNTTVLPIGWLPTVLCLRYNNSIKKVAISHSAREVLSSWHTSFCTNAGLHRPSGMDIGTWWVSKPWH